MSIYFGAIGFWVYVRLHVLDMQSIAFLLQADLLDQVSWSPSRFSAMQIPKMKWKDSLFFIPKEHLSQRPYGRIYISKYPHWYWTQDICSRFKSCAELQISVSMCSDRMSKKVCQKHMQTNVPCRSNCVVTHGTNEACATDLAHHCGQCTEIRLPARPMRNLWTCVDGNGTIQIMCPLLGGLTRCHGFGMMCQWSNGWRPKIWIQGELLQNVVEFNVL